MEKFNVVSNDHGRTQKCDFPVLDPKYPFCANLVQKNQSCLFKDITNPYNCLLKKDQFFNQNKEMNK